MLRAQKMHCFGPPLGKYGGYHEVCEIALQPVCYALCDNVCALEWCSTLLIEQGQWNNTFVLKEKRT